MSFINHPKYAQVMTLTNSFITAISTQQADYFIANGQYFQGVPLVNGTPDGIVDVDANVNSKPENQNETWFDFLPTVFTNQLKVPFQVTLNKYEAPEGFGWTMKIEVWRAGLGPDSYGTDGDHWVYRYHEGPVAQPGIFNQWYIESDAEV